MSTGTSLEFSLIQDKETLAYIAGLIDAMASMSIMTTLDKDGFRHWSCKFTIATTDKRIMEFLDEIFGVKGRALECGITPFSSKWNSPKEKTLFYHWRISGDLLRHVLDKCYPWIRFKKEHIDILRLYNSTIKGRGRGASVDDEATQIRLKCRDALAALNRKCKRKPPLVLP